MKYILLLLFVSASLNARSQKTIYDSLIQSGFEMLNHSDFPNAYNIFEKANEIDSARVESFYGMGVSLLYNCQNIYDVCDKCLYYLNKSISIDPNYRKSYYNRGRCEMFLGKFKDALVDFNYAYLLSPNDTANLNSRGLTKIKLNDMAEACKDFEIGYKLGSIISMKAYETYCHKK